MSKEINVSQGKYFPKAFATYGYILMLVGLITFLGNIWAAFAMILIGIYLAFSFCGIEFDLAKNAYREYSIYFGIHSGGKWKDLSKLTDMSVLQTRVSETTYSRSNRTTTDSDTFYDVFLLSKTHRTKVFVERFKDKNFAFSKAKELSNTLNKEFKKYHPAGSIRIKQ